MIGNQDTFLMRFYQYQKERFPFLVNGPLIFIFTFSAIAYSSICRDGDGFIQIDDLLAGFITTFFLFFLLRVLDEFKDRETDRKYRSELPLPRGLITFSELKVLGLIAICFQLLAIGLVHPSMIYFYICVLIYLSFMTVEFFAPDWLNYHLWAYTASHMVIIPLVDIYASGLDWHLSSYGPHLGLLWFFGVSYFNGIVLEVGRKLKAEEQEKEGVVTYSGLMGLKKAIGFWVLFLTITAVLAMVACLYASLPIVSYYILLFAYLISLAIAYYFVKNPSPKSSNLIEIFSGIWTLLMYGTLGGVPGFLIYVLA